MTEDAGSAKPFVWPVRIYYEDTDAAGVVYYANYLRFLERARTEWLRAAGFDQSQLAIEVGVAFVVRAVAIEYLRPARFDDALEVTVELDRLGASQIDVVQRVLRREELLATAKVKVVCVGVSTLRPARIPQPLLGKLGKTH